MARGKATGLNFAGIYAIKNKVNGKQYIGSAVNIRMRWDRHRRLLREGKHHSNHLQRAWNQCGEKVFIFEVIERVDNASALLVREQYWLDTFRTFDDRNGYNMSPTAGNRLGMRHSQETKLKIGLTSKGRVVSEESRKKRSETLKGRKRPEHIRRKVAAVVSEIWTGRKHTEETKRKMKEARARQVRPPHTEETKRKMSLAAKRRCASQRRDSSPARFHQLQLNLLDDPPATHIEEDQ